MAESVEKFRINIFFQYFSLQITKPYILIIHTYTPLILTSFILMWL